MFFREDEDAIFEEDTNEWVTQKQAEHIRQLRSANERLRQQLEVARKALEPYATQWKMQYSGTVIKQEEAHLLTTTTALIHLRAAASAYEQISETEKSPDTLAGAGHFSQGER